jgi:Protein of unknown function (DUF3293)
VTVPARLLRAYRTTAYVVDGVVCRIGRRCPPGVAGVFITAWNPRSRLKPAGWNARMQKALAARLRRWPVRVAEGRGRGWREAHLLVDAPEAVVLRLALMFRQNAVVVARGRVRLMVF